MTPRPHRSFFRTGLAIFLIAWALRLAIAFASHRFTDLSRFDMERIAVELAEPDTVSVIHLLNTGYARQRGDIDALAMEALAHEQYGASEGIAARSLGSVSPVRTPVRIPIDK